MRKQSRDIYAQKYLDRGYELIGDYIGSTKSHNVKCIKCGNTSKKTLHKCKTERCWGCYLKNKENFYTDDEAKNIFYKKGYILLQEYTGRYDDKRIDKDYLCKCKECGYEAYKTMSSLCNNSWCIKCLENKRLDVATEKYAKNNFIMMEDYKGAHHCHKVKCIICGDISSRRPSHDHRCKGCYEIARKEEIKLFMEKYGKYDTYRQYVESITCKNIKKYNMFSEYEFGRKKYHIDHKVSVYYGYRNGISPEIISHPCNLEVMWYIDNIRKNKKCSITMEKLMEMIKVSDTAATTARKTGT